MKSEKKEKKNHVALTLIAIAFFFAATAICDYSRKEQKNSNGNVSIVANKFVKVNDYLNASTAVANVLYRNAGYIKPNVPLHTQH